MLEVPPYAQQGSVVIAAESVAFAASGVPRDEPYYASREERRHALHARVVADVFVVDRLSLGGAFHATYQRDAAGASFHAGATARVGYVLGGVLWPGAFVGVRREESTVAFGGVELRLVLPITKTILITLGPRLEIDHDKQRTWSLAIGLAGTTRTDGVPRPIGRTRFGYRGQRVLQLQMLATSRSTYGASVGLDGFLWHGASIGSFVGAETRDHNTALTAGARVGQAIIFSDRVWWWGRVGFQLARAHAGDGDPRTVFEATVEMPFIASLAKGVGLTCGPFLNVPLVRSSVRNTSVGVGSSLVLFF